MSVSRSPAYEAVLTAMRAGQTVLLDGAISTELDSRGVLMTPGEDGSPSPNRLAAVAAPEVLIALHVDYIRAGARVITAHTFGHTRAYLEDGGAGDRFEELNRCAVECALEARRRTQTEGSVLVAGSLTHHMAKGPGKYSPPREPGVFEREMKEMVAIQKAAGVDLFLLEMVGCPTFTPPMIRAVQAYHMPFWLGLSAKDTALATGTQGDGVLRVYNDEATPLAEALPAVIACAKGAEGVDTGCDLAGAMHCKPGVIGPTLELIRDHGWDG